ncbi:hypothetical protein NL108_014000 [Boleophthalmus pectinirostris]|uniref:telomeric repeat-binding factor 2-interacting protein 1 n=1 Tax=Boleophthalmus pectinirostris TaxID=150288 RepID=UPI00242E9046|nr:telomeric repeat-binding factor 2-interacting protein 1 [Boleophthalmus pectinirostris]KAJ0068880.1 hypothetical protein NL108_014000 [Boleophthalmus pectinirostris]
MSSKSNAVTQPKTLFVSEEGEPLSFYLRPGPMKQELLPLIKAGGGLLCNFQKPGTIMLRDPEDGASIPERIAHWYVSTKYIQDCIEKNKRLNMEEYRLNPESTNSRKTKKKSNSKVGSPAITGGRSAYTAEEDDAILSYVSKHESEIGGNKLWQEMAKKTLTSHSWQSMKYRYRVQLAPRLSEFKRTDSAKKNKTQNADQIEPENKASPQKIQAEVMDLENISAEMDLTQISQSSDSQEEQANVEPAKCHDSETRDSMETSKSETDEIPELLLPDGTTTEKDGPIETTAKNILNSNDKLPNSVNCPVTREQDEFENITYHIQQCKQKLHLQVSSPQKDQRKDQSPPKKVRRETEPNITEQMQQESESGQSKVTHTDEGNCPALQPSKKKVKRKLGILEMATKEFEDDTESDSDLSYETARPSTSIEAVIGSSNSGDPSTLNQEKDPGNTRAEQNPQPTTNTNTTASVAITTATPATNNASTANTAVPQVTTRGHPSVTEQVLSKAHLFIFESESQELEEDSQSLVGSHSPSAVQTNEQKNGPSLTQDQQEEDVQLLRDFMKHTNQNLFNVTKALLKASGDLFLAYKILQNPSSFSGPIWTCTDDQRLHSTDQEVRQELLTKYGEEGVAKRLLFLEMEG